MNQISIGDSTAWTNIEGASISTGFRHSTAFFKFSSEPFVQEHIEIELYGSSLQISAAFTTLENIKLRSIAYAQGEYAHPQTLRFQPLSGGAYYYAQISGIFLEAHPKAYLTHTTGSFLVNFRYTRPNFFDSAQVELPLTGEYGTDVTGGFNLINKADGTGALSAIAMVKAAHAVSDLPAPVRVELTNTFAADVIKDIFIGNFYHPSNSSRNIFFKNVTDFTGGTQIANAGAIAGYYRSRTWTSAAWTSLFSTTVAYSYVNLLAGHTFRPIIHLYAKHAYADLYFKLVLLGHTYTIKDCEPVYSDPDYQYVILPPIQIPPNQLLHENNPDDLDIEIHALKVDGAVATVAFDQLFFFPTDYGADFKAFYRMGNGDKFYDDTYLHRTNVRYNHPSVSGGAELVAHNRIGSDLLLYPNHNNFFIFLHSNSTDQMVITRTSKVSLYYRPRISIL